MPLFCMKDKTPPMAHQLSSPESNHQILPQPSKLKKPHHLKSQKMGQEHQDNIVKDGCQHLDELVFDSQYLKRSVSDSYFKELVSDHRLEDISSSPKKYSDKDNNTFGQTQTSSKVNEEEIALDNDVTSKGTSVEGEDSGRERLKRHRVEVAGRVWIPEIWGQEELLKDWIDCAAFDASLVPSRIVMARAALVEEGRRATSNGLRIENRC